MAVDWLESEVAAHDAALVKLLAEEWILDDEGRFDALGEVVSFLEDTDWDDYKDDKEYLVGELNRQLKKSQKKDFDMGVLQGDVGVHELRRDLRWFPI